MQPASPRLDEENALAELQSLEVLDSEPENVFDALVRVASRVCGTPISLISLVDSERQWFKANVGLPGVHQTPRELAFCAHAVLGDDVFVVPDALADERFRDNPLVTDDPDIRFYAGAPLRMDSGARIGTLCVIDREPRQLDDTQLAVLRDLAEAAVEVLAGRRARRRQHVLALQAVRAALVLKHSADAVISFDLEGRITQWNGAAERLFGHRADEMHGESLATLLAPGETPVLPRLLARLAAGEARTSECERLTRDGRRLHVAVTLVPEFDSTGALTGGTEFVRDHTARERAARALSVSEARFRTLSDSAPHGVFHTDAGGQCTYTNARWQAIFGIGHDRAAGDGWLSAVHPDDLSRVMAEWRRTTQERCSVDAQFRVLRPDGSTRLVRALAQATIGADGRIDGFVGSIEDETERQGLLTRLRQLYESTPAMLHSIDVEGRLLSVSDAWLARLGYRREEVLGRRMVDFLAPASRQRAESVELPAFFASGRCQDVAYQMVSRTGELVEVRVSALLERDALGRPQNSLAVVEDVGARVRAEQALETEHRRLVNILEATRIGTWEWHVPGGEVRVNEHWAAMIGHTLETLGPLNARTWRLHVHPDDLGRARALQEQHCAGLIDHYACEIRLRHRDGRWVWVQARGKLMSWTPQGAPEWMFGTHEDITERRLQHERLRKSQAMLDRTGRLAAVGGWELDLATQAVFWSDETCRLHGVAPGYQPSLDEAIAFYAPEARAHVQIALEEAIHENRPFDIELPMVRRDGERIVVHAKGAVERDAQGRGLRLVGALQDITARVREQAALRRQSERAALATDSGGIGIYDFDLVHKVLVWDDWMYRLYGLAPRAIAASQALWLQHVHPDDRAPVRECLQEAIDSGRPVEAEFRIVWPDGSLRHLRASAQVTRDAQGTPVRLVGANWDVTESRRLAAELAEQAELLRVTLQSIGDAVITTDAAGCVAWMNPVAERMTGWTSDEARGRVLSQVFHIVNEETRAPAENPVAACLSEGEVKGLPTHTVLISRDGVEYGIEDSAAPIRNRQGVMLGVVLVFHDVTEQRRLSGEMSYRATHDPLTGLVNRTEFENRLRRVLHSAHEDRSEHALLYLDLDQFKLVNDACGHTVGDRLLQQVAKLLHDGVRARDTLARLGGDEFGVILEHCSADKAQRVAQQLCERMDEFRFVHDERRFRIGLSIGMVPVDSRWPTTAAILQAADTSCYAAKEEGRNRVHAWFDTDQAMRARHGEMQWASRIEQAVDEQRFELHAQRIEALDPAAPGLHAEVLLRLRDSDGSLVLPGAFLPAAERFHLATRLDRWVLKATLDWLEARPADAPMPVLSVNLSGQSIGDRAFHRWALELLRQTPTARCRSLCLEITETAAVTNYADAALFIEQVRQAGVRVALDDFGAGASSFGYLKSLVVDLLKIDGQFVRDVLDDPLDAAAVRSFIDVARVVGVRTVAECVEDPAVLARVRELGVDYAQGYLLHRPVPLDALFSTGTVALGA